MIHFFIRKLHDLNLGSSFRILSVLFLNSVCYSRTTHVRAANTFNYIIAHYIIIYFFQVFWAFSIYLEAVAILPQLFLLQRSGNVDNLAAQYVFFLGYILNLSHLFLVGISLVIQTSHHEHILRIYCSVVFALLNLRCIPWIAKPEAGEAKS